MKENIITANNGPLVLKYDGTQSIVFKDGKRFHAPSPAYLCRCGASKKKPFCDGSHQNIGFTEKKEIKSETIQNYPGKEINVTFNRSICAGAANCVNMLPEVFSEDDSSDWITPDAADKESIIQIIKTCPSGALSYTIDDKISIDTRTTAKVTIVKDGPYNVEAVDLKVQSRPTNASSSKYSLCRCGKSKNKPYCDYTHAQEKWSDEN